MAGICDETMEYCSFYGEKEVCMFCLTRLKETDTIICGNMLEGREPEEQRSRTGFITIPGNRFYRA